MAKETAVDFFYNNIKSHFQHDGDLLECLDFIYKTAKQMEREQHGNTWQNAIETHEERGLVIARSLTDFDEYEIE